MPTYGFTCNDCCVEFEVFHGINETPEIHCDNCNSTNLQQQFYAPTCFTKGEATSVKMLAERNAKRMGREEVQERGLKNKEAREARLGKPRKRLWPKVNLNEIKDVQKYVATGDKS